MAETTDRIGALVRGLAQPTAALAVALVLTALLTFPFLPTWLQLEAPLRPEPGADVLPREQLEERIEALERVDQVRVLLVEGASRLILEGVEEAELVESEVGDLLEQSGYQRDEWTRNEVVHMDRLLWGQPGVLPVMMSIQALVFLAAGLWFGRRLPRGGLPENPSSLPRAILLGVAAGAVALVLSAGLGLLLRQIGLPVEEQAWLTELAADPGALMRIAPWVVLIAPVAEEVFFRFYVLRHIASHAGMPAGFVISSFLFALIHFNPTGLLVYLAIGCVLAAVYQRTGRLAAPIAGHVTLNAIVLAASAFAI